MKRLNLAQCHLEAAIGSAKKAAEVHEKRGDTNKAIRLMQHALDIARLRDPEAIEILESRRLKRVEAERQRA